VESVPSRQPFPPADAPPDPSDPSERPGWLARFYRGERSVLEACYREHFARVERALRPVLGGADRETVIHELFSRLIAREEFRRGFRGGALGAWLTTTARNQAIDFRRRLRREVSTPDGGVERPEAVPASSWEDATQARLLIEDFRRRHVPAAWQGVFELRFLQQLPQREAAARLSMSRTTLAIREIRLRRRLKRHFLTRGTP
jgi:RNA polymerase sigma-70 factor (ECF subfamily)